VLTPDIPIFLNPGAGKRSDAEREALVAAFIAAGARPDIRESKDAAIRAAVEAGVPVVGAAGGDGTISAVANIVAGTDTALLPIPLGTLNHFSKRYGNTTIEAAAQAWKNGVHAAINTGSVNGRIFVNNASCGFYPHAVRHREHLERWLSRLPAMWLAGLRVLIELPLMETTVEVGHMQQRLRTPALWVGIGRNSLRLPVPGDAENEGDVLEMVSGRAETRRAILLMGLRLFRHLKRGLQPEAANLAVHRAREFKLHSRRPIDIALDGEPFRMDGPLEFVLRQDALKVVGLVTPRL
jgi:diacylglycerol kinase family enzyme